MILKKIATKPSDSISKIRMFILNNNNSECKDMIYKYESLSENKKIYIAKYTYNLILNKYLNNEKFIDQIYSYLILSNCEDNLNSNEILINYFLSNINNNSLIKKLCEVIFEIIDREISNEKFNHKIISNCLEIIILIKNKINKDHSIINFISSNLIARSNINSFEFRIFLVYYFADLEDNELFMQKILSRFGQSLLEYIFEIYFSNPKKSNIAFSFLYTHLHIFIYGSSLLIDLGKSVLQNQMLKQHKEFILFLENYLNTIKKDHEKMKIISIYLSILLKKSCEINKYDLIEKLKEIIIKHFKNIQIFNEINYFEQIDTAINILEESHSKNIREPIKIIKNLSLEFNQNITHKFFKKKFKKNNSKINTIENSSLSIKEILLLAS